MRRRYFVVLGFTLLLIFTCHFDVGMGDDKFTVTPFSSEVLASKYNESIVIRSNSDFAANGWFGNGSKTNPYTLDGISFYTPRAPCIEIRNTDAYFVLNNSIITSNYGDAEEGIITMYNAANGIIYNCQLSDYAIYDGVGFYGSQVSNISIMDCWISGKTGIVFEESTQCFLVGNRITPRNAMSSFNGIYLVSSDQMVVRDNTVLYKDSGIYMETTDHSIIMNNSVFGCQYGIGFDNQLEYANQSKYNIIYNNSIGWSLFFNTVDYGFQNQWDDNISVGNAYSDYNESGSYEIHANGLDNFPKKLDDDLFGPRVEHYFPYFGFDYVEPGPANFTIYTDVTDISGVDTVLLNYNGTILEMNKTSDESFPNRFFTVLPYRGLYRGSIYFLYSFKANDSLGNCFETTDYYGYIAVWLQNTPGSPNNPIISLPLPLIILVGIAIAVVGSCIVYIDRRWIEERERYIKDTEQEGT